MTIYIHRTIHYLKLSYNTDPVYFEQVTGQHAMKEAEVGDVNVAVVCDVKTSLALDVSKLPVVVCCVRGSFYLRYYCFHVPT